MKNKMKRGMITKDIPDRFLCLANALSQPVEKSEITICDDLYLSEVEEMAPEGELERLAESPFLVSPYEEIDGSCNKFIHLVEDGLLTDSLELELFNEDAKNESITGKYYRTIIIVLDYEEMESLFNSDDDDEEEMTMFGDRIIL